MAITHGARLYVHVGDIGAEPTPTDGPPVDLNSTGTGTPSRSAPGSPKSSSVDGLPPVTPGKLSLPPRQDSISSTGHRLSSLPDSPLPKSVAQLISAASRHSSPARVRSPASTLNSDAASEGGASSTMTPIRHVPGSNFFSDDADVQTGSVKSAVSQPGRTLSDGISGTTSERRRVSVGKPPLTPSQIIVTTVDTTPAKPSRPVIIGPPAEVAQYPSMMLANNPKHFGLLLSLLELPSPLCDNAWKLVSILPPNAALTDTVLSLSTCDVKGFTSVCASLFGARTTYKSLYSLILLENIAKVPAPAAGSAALTSPLLNTGFVNGFLSRGGIAVLTQLFQACSTVCSPASPSMCDIQSLLLLVRLHTLLLPVASDASLTGSILPIALASLQVWATAPITPDVEELLVQLLKLLKLSWSTASSAELTLSSVLPSLLLHECRHVRATTAAFCYWLCSSADGCVGYDAGSVPLNEPKLSSPPNRTVSFLNGSLTSVLTVIAADANKESCRANTFELMRLLCRLCWRVCASGVSEPVLPVLKWISTVFSRIAPFEHDFQQSGTLESPVDKVYEGQVGVPAGLATALLTCYTDDDPYDTFLTVMGVSISESLPFLAVKDDDESRSGGSGEKAPTAPANNALNDEDVMAGEPQPGRDELLTGSLVLFRVILRGDTQWGTAPAVLTEAISTGLVTQIASIVLNSTGNNLALMLCSRLAAFGALFDIASGVLLPRIASGVVKGSSENLAVIQAFRYLSTSPPARECFVLVMQALQEHMEAVMSEANVRVACPTYYTNL